jgi:hypothetical protein
VRKFITIEPRRVYLSGAVGEEISQTVTIIPHTEKPLRIMTVQAMMDTNISYKLEETEKDGRRAYELAVSNISEEPGKYRDRIVLLTNMSDRPPMSITVVGHLTEKQAAAQD